MHSKKHDLAKLRVCILEGFRAFLNSPRPVAHTPGCVTEIVRDWLRKIDAIIADFHYTTR